jgi:hypothetical protein
VRVATGMVSAIESPLDRLLQPRNKRRRSKNKKPRA